MSKLRAASCFWNFVHTESNESSIRTADRCANLSGHRRRTQGRATRKIPTLFIGVWRYENVAEEQFNRPLNRLCHRTIIAGVDYDVRHREGVFDVLSELSSNLRFVSSKEFFG